MHTGFSCLPRISANVSTLLFFLAVAGGAQVSVMEVDATMTEMDHLNARGRFVRCYWFEKGIEHGNPLPTSRLRVNAPEAVLGKFKNRSEVRSNGMVQIRIAEDLSLLEGAELYLELWGGHPGTANKRVTPNGRTTYEIPRVGTEKMNCTYQYPTIPLKVTDLVNGYNAFQFACDQGGTFWGHYIVDNACLRCELKRNHPDLKKMNLERFDAAVKAQIEGEKIHLRLVSEGPGIRPVAGPVEFVEYWGCYNGYDENGNRKNLDWHGFTKDRRSQAIIGISESPPLFEATWDVSMLPDQDLAPVRVQAVVHVKEQPEIMYETGPLIVPFPKRPESTVRMFTSKDLPHPFWSRASRERTCTIGLDIEPSEIERAQLHVVIWDGGGGKVADPFTINGHPLPVAGTGKHDVLYRVIDVPAVNLKRGGNVVRLLSDTLHHGIEVLLPGPALVVRSRGKTK